MRARKSSVDIVSQPYFETKAEDFALIRGVSGGCGRKRKGKSRVEEKVREKR